MFLRKAEGEPWPDLSDTALAETLPDWLGPHLTRLTRLDEIGADRLSEALHDLLPWSLRARLDAEAPTHLDVPTGSRIPVDYAAEGGRLWPWVQELFGLTPPSDHRRRPGCRSSSTCSRRPSARSRSPATCRASGAAPGRRCAPTCAANIPPPWPEDPTTAPPTRRAKPRGT